MQGQSSYSRFRWNLGIDIPFQHLLQAAVLGDWQAVGEEEEEALLRRLGAAAAVVVEAEAWLRFRREFWIRSLNERPRGTGKVAIRY